MDTVQIILIVALVIMIGVAIYIFGFKGKKK
jgi:hypothetical protein